MAAWPPLACQALPPSYVQSLWAAAFRYLVRLSVVPESSERWNAWILVSGSVAPGFSFLIAASFHLVILLLKIFARVGASRIRLSTPGEVVGDGDRAADHREVDALAAGADLLGGGDLFGLQRASRSRRRRPVPWLKAVTPAPEPLPLVVDLTPEQAAV